MEKLNILYTCDNAYLDMTGISIASVIENNKNRDICFYIATEEDNSDNFNKLKDFYKDNNHIEFRYLDCKKYDCLLEEKNLDRWGSNSYYVYWKLFAYDLLDVDYIWYLDSDVICLSEIDYPVINRPIGGVLDCAHVDFNKLAHIDENYYLYNTGSLFVDINKWKENRCVEKVVEYIENIQYKPLLCDQDILAIALQNEIELIDPKYDYLVGYDYYDIHNTFEMYSLNKKPFYKEDDIEKAKNNIVFYHCLGGVFGRPYEVGNESPIKEEYEKYTKLSAWPDYKKEKKVSTLFSIEKKLEVLPDSIYNRIHNLAQRVYLRKLSKSINKQ